MTFESGKTQVYYSFSSIMFAMNINILFIIVNNSNCLFKKYYYNIYISVHIYL